MELCYVTAVHRLVPSCSHSWHLSLKIPAPAQLGISVHELLGDDDMPVDRGGYQKMASCHVDDTGMQQLLHIMPCEKPGGIY